MKQRKQKQKTPGQQRKQAGRRQRMFGFAGKVLFAAVLLTAALLALTVFFKVDAIEVEGVTRYAAADIADGLQIEQGDNLYLWNKVEQGETLCKDFPYLESVQIRRHLPDRIVVTVTECTAALAVPTDGGFYILSDTGKVLELAQDAGALPVVTGVSLMGMTPGDMLDPKTDAYVDVLLTLLHELRENAWLEHVDFVNLQVLTDIRIGLYQRFDVRVGTVDKLGYRLRFAATVVSERLSPSDIGRLYWDGKERLHFVPDTAENVARSATMLEPAPEVPAGNADEGAPDEGADDATAGDADTGDTDTGDEQTAADTPDDAGGDDGENTAE